METTSADERWIIAQVGVAVGGGHRGDRLLLHHPAQVTMGGDPRSPEVGDGASWRHSIDG
jgi:hypothetical protein